MKFNLGITQSSIDISFDYPNLVVGSFIPFIWNLNTRKFNLEGRVWNYTGTDNFYLKLVSQYTHQDYIWDGDVLTTNDRFTEAEFTNISGTYSLANTETDGFFYCYFIIEPVGGDPLCIYENLAYIQIEGKRTTFTPMITNNEDREIIFA